jgi:hypothetical protein
MLGSSAEKVVVAHREARGRQIKPVMWALLLACGVSSRILAEEAPVQTPNTTSSPSLECSAHLRSFIAEIDQKIETSTSVDPLRETIKKYFPLSGCDVDDAVSISRKSKYFDRADQFQKDVVIVLRKKNPGTWGFEVSFALSRETGDSKLSAAIVDKIKRE